MTLTNKKEGNFDWVAPVYDALTRLVFGRRLQRAQIVFLTGTDVSIQVGTSILLVGGGTGWLLDHLLRHCQPKRVVYLESSVQMMNRASRRMVKNGVPGSVEFRVSNETDLLPTDRFDVLITPFVLDLFTEQTLRQRMIPMLHQTLKPGGHWLVTDFAPTEIWWQKALLWTMIRFFQVTAGIETRELADWQRLISEAGLICQKRRLQVGGMVSSEVWVKTT